MGMPVEYDLDDVTAHLLEDARYGWLSIIELDRIIAKIDQLKIEVEAIRRDLRNPLLPKAKPN